MSAETTRSGHLKVRGVDLAYAWHGPETGHPFVLVHGFTGSSDDWADHVQDLASVGPTVTFDLRGHGDSTNLGDTAAYTLEHIVDDLAAALGELGIETCDLLGHSMGGMAALRFALAHPDRLRSLVLMDTTDEPIELAPPAIFEKLVEHVEAGGTEALLQVVEARRDQRAEAQRRYEERVGEENARARIHGKLHAMDPAAFVGFARALGARESVRARLGEIRCPTLVMVGDQDEPFLAPTDAMAERIPNAQKAVIRGAAHSPQLENPEAWLAAIRAHLERASSAAR